jgi:hypothetical protein
MAEENTQPDRPVEKTIPFEWPEGVPAVYANNLLVQNDAGVLVLSFFQVNPPYIMGDSPAERREALEKIQSIKAIPSAKIVIPLHHIPKMIEILQKRLEIAEEEAEARVDDTND